MKSRLSVSPILLQSSNPRLIYRLLFQLISETDGNDGNPQFRLWWVLLRVLPRITLIFLEDDSQGALEAEPEMIEFLVGPQKRRFLVHRSLLCQKVPFFRDRLAERPSAKRFHLSKWKTYTVEVLVKWVYGVSVVSSRNSIGAESQDMIKLRGLLYMADNLSLEALRDEVYTALRGEDDRS